MMRSMAAMHDLDALQVAAQYAGGGLSPVDVARASLERIEAWEPRLNAMYRIDREGALAAAKAAEARWRARPSRQAKLCAAGFCKEEKEEESRLRQTPQMP